MRPFLLSTTSALLASLMTWLMVRPAPRDGEAAGAGPPHSSAAREGGREWPRMNSGVPEDLSKKPDRWKEHRGPGGRIPPESMDAAVQSMLLERDPLLAMEAFSSLLRELTPDNAAAAWQGMSGRVHGAEALRYLPLLGHAWGVIDGPGALAVIKAGGDRDEVKARLSVMGGWATRDSGGALAWLKEQAAGAESLPTGRKEALRELRLLKAGLVRGLAAHDPEAALRLLPGMEEVERTPMVALIAREQYRLGMDAATQWAGSISDPALREHALTNLVRQYAGDDPAKAAAWLSGQKELGSSPGPVGSVAREWAGRDPGAAVQWIGGLPEGAARNEAWEDALRSWTQRDPLASSNYLTQMPTGPSRDSAVSSLSRTIAREDPEAAIQWAGTIGDPVTRESALVRSVQLWHSQDQAGAAQWIEANGILPEVQQRMLAPLKTKEGKGWKGGPGPKAKNR